MKRNHQVIFVLCIVVLALASCSGLKNAGSGGGGGTATFSLALTDTPPANVSILSFKVAVTGVTLNPASGSPVNLSIGANPVTLDLKRLETDAAFLGAFNIPAGTYSSITLSVANPDLTFANQTGATLSGCPNNTDCEIVPASAGNLTFSGAPFPLTLTSGQLAGLRLDFNLNNAITSTATTMTVDFMQPNVLGATALPLAGQPSGQFALIEDFNGVVTAVNQTAKTLTLQSNTRGALNLAADATTGFDNFQPTCLAADFTCVHLGQTLSVDAALRSDGSLLAKEIELEENTADDELEGVVFSVDSFTQFKIVATDKVQAATNSLLTSVTTGSPVIVTLQANPIFVVDTKGLNVPPSPLSFFQSAIDTSEIFSGQMVQVRVRTFTAGAGGSAPTVAVNRVRLRFSRFTAVISGQPASPFFNVAGLPKLFGAATPLQVQTFPSKTNFEGVTDVTGLSNGNTVSVRALFINAVPAFYAAKVRKR